MNLSEVKTYESAVSYCLAVPRYTKKNDMESTRAFFAYLGKPGTNAQIIHIAGTNGKGSVSAFLQSICLKGGKKVGMFTSPHLVSVRERMRIGNNLISKQEFITIYEKLEEKIKLYHEITKKGENNLMMISISTHFY